MKNLNTLFFSRLSAGSKIGIVVALLVLAISYLMYSTIRQNLASIGRDEGELQGLKLVWPVYEIITPIQQVRGNTNRYLNGDDSVLPKIREGQRTVDAKISALVSLASNEDIRLRVDVVEELNRFRLHWENLKDKEFSGKPDEVFARYTDAVQQLRQILTTIADKSGLSFDSQATSAYLINLATNFALHQQELIGITRGKGSGMLAKEESGETVSFQQKNSLTKVAAGLGMSEVYYQLKQVFVADPNIDNALRNYATNAHDAINDFSNRMLDYLSGEGKSITSTESWEGGTHAIAEIRTLVSQSLPWIETTIQERIDAQYNQFYWLLLTSSVAVIIALSFAGWILSDLRSKYEEERRIAIRLTQIKQALDSVKTSVVMVDKHHTVTYLNDAANILFKLRENEIQCVNPDFRAKRLTKDKISAIANIPYLQPQFLDDLTHAMTEDVQIGALYFNLTVIPVFNDENERIGTVTEWLDTTSERMSERQIKDIIDRAQNGDLNSRIDTYDKEGFFLYVAEGLNQMMDIIGNSLEETVRVFDALSDGKLDAEIEGMYNGTFAKLQNDANSTIRRLNQVVVDMRQSASSVSNGAEEIAAANQDLSKRTEEQSSSLEETAASMEQMTTTLSENSDQATAASKLAQHADERASEGGKVVSAAISAMADINQSSRKISEIISVIDVLAFQTNLLALNASVEAARAGEQGRGFAVVAGEVRSLAQRCATAAKEIKTLIEDSVSKVESGSELINRSGATLEEIQKAVSDVNVLITQLATSATEQAMGIQQVNQAVSQMDVMTQQNAAMVEETATASATMASQAKYMLSLLSFFSTKNEPTTLSPMLMPEIPKPKPVERHDANDWDEF